MEDNIERIKDELEEARQSLHQTVTEVNRKVETVSTQLQPSHIVGRNLLLSACIAGALGFASGYRGNTPVAVLVLGGLLGAALSEAWNE
jgi:4-hydroxybenzoate polyprenyltransferase